MARAVFVVPPTGRFVREERCQGSTEGLLTHGLRPPVDLALLAAVLERHGWTCAVLDGPAEGLDAAAATAWAVAFHPDLVTVQTTVSTLARDAAFLAGLRAALPGATTVAFGSDFGVDPAGRLASLPPVDVVAWDEVEAAFDAFARTGSWRDVPGAAWRDGGAVRVGAVPAPADLDALPRPARHLVRNDLYRRPDTGRPQTVIVVGRGCPHRCTFCLVDQKSGRRVRLRSPASVIDEVRSCILDHGIRDFLFLADLFTADRDWVVEVCRGLAALETPIRWVCNSRVDTLDEERVAWMRRAGCWGVSLGIESGDDATLRRIRKGTTVARAREAVALLRRHGILSLGYLMIGFPWEDEAAIRRSFEGFLAVDPDVIEVLFPYPFPGTVIRDEMIAAGVLGAGDLPDDACAMPAAPTTTVPVARLLELRRRFLRRFLVRPAFLRRAARVAADPAVVRHVVCLGWGVAARLAGSVLGLVRRPRREALP